MFTQKFKVQEVFSPRRAEVNEKIYIHRPDLEDELKKAINGSLNVVLYGESGSGKSWLYKKSLADLSALVVNVNCAQVSRNGSISDEICKAAIPAGTMTVAGITEKKEASVSTVVATGKLDHTKNYQVAQEDPLLLAFRTLRKSAGGESVVVVLDNLELIFDTPARMDELASILTLLDDSTFAPFAIKFMIVGTRSEIRDYFIKTKNLPTVANRLRVLNEVKSLSRIQVDQLTTKGFKELLHANIPDQIFKLWQQHIWNVTLGIPQSIHEYCEHLGHLLEQNDWRGEEQHTHEADTKWLAQGLRSSYDIIESVMNEKRTEAGRRNQVLYALSGIQNRLFNYSDVENIIRREFPISTGGKQLNVSQLLSELSKRENPIIKQPQKSSDYEFTQARYLMCIRAMLSKTADEKVEKIDL